MEKEFKSIMNVQEFLKIGFLEGNSIFNIKIKDSEVVKAKLELIKN